MELQVSKQQISPLELSALMLTFMMGTSMILPIAYGPGRDSWISVILGTCIAIVITWFYSSLCQSYLGKSIVDIAEIEFGKWIGKIVAIIYAWYALQLGSYVLRNFVDFTNTVLLSRTPVLVIYISMMVIVGWVVFEGLQILSRAAQFFIIFTMLQIILNFSFLLPDMDSQNIIPILNSNWKSIWQGAYEFATIPLGETILFAMLIPFINNPSKISKVVLSSVSLVGFFLLITYLTNILVLGDLVSNLSYPSYTVTMYISIGDFLERVEPLAFMVWVFGGFAKISVCLLVASLLIGKISGTKEYKIFIIPIALLMIELSIFMHPNNTDVSAFAKEVWPWYSIPFQFLIPLILLTYSKIKKIHKPQ